MFHCFVCGNKTRNCRAFTSDFSTTCSIYLNVSAPGSAIEPPVGDSKQIVCDSCKGLLRRKTSESVKVDRKDADDTPSKMRRIFPENSDNVRRARIRERGCEVFCDIWSGPTDETLHSILTSLNGRTLTEDGTNLLGTAVKQYKCVIGVGDAAASIEKKRQAAEEDKRVEEERLAREDEACKFRVGDDVCDSGNMMPGFNEPAAIGGRVTKRVIVNGDVFYDIYFPVERCTRKQVFEARLSAEPTPPSKVLCNGVLRKMPSACPHDNDYNAAIDSAKRLRRTSREHQLKLQLAEQNTEAREKQHRKEKADLAMKLEVEKAHASRKISHLNRNMSIMEEEQNITIESAVRCNEKKNSEKFRLERRKEAKLHRQLSDELEKLQCEREATEAGICTKVQEAAAAAEATVRSEMTAALSSLANNNKALQEQLEQVRNPPHTYFHLLD